MLQKIIAELSFSLPELYLPLVLVPISLIGVFGWRFWKRKNTYKSLNSIPSPPRHWLLGNIPQVLAAVENKKYSQFLFDWSQKLGTPYILWAGDPILILSKPKVIEETIINGTKDGSLVRSRKAQKAWNDISGPILLGQHGTNWQWRRKAWNPGFTANALSKYLEIVDESCSQVVENIKKSKPSEAVRVDPLFVELTLKVISCLVLGIPVDRKVSSPEGPPLEIEKVYDATSVVSYRFLRVVTGKEKKWYKYLPLKTSRDYWSARRYLNDFLIPRVDLALQLRDGKQGVLKQVSPCFQESMLVKIAAREPKYNRETLISETIQLLIGGTDTTAHTLSFAVGELALNPRVFQQAQSVVDKVWSSQGKFDLESLKELNYIRAIVKETLRTYSIASGSTSLQAIRDTTIEGINIPRGTKVFWSMLAAGRDPETYEQPEEFRPERWLEGKGSHSLPNIEFGSGSHRCLGEHLAMLEATIMLAQLLRYFNWELVNGRSSLENWQQNILIYPSDGMPLRFQLR
ncbi:cytochrome P450 [Mastigocoleus testarum]|uniref:Cytochrome P450 n=1 Tax=Mastigocoleus testarum BC008 TaxID=371196 RepID=A0A0V7ZKA7_9CYAN|nr:cytochrome P450 [Mastigocoleus testarum]KST64973.1 cytochrome P450 [Mastigocoleus testarum BC008]KST64979.1 cytochrome P450 [Mastigocoleus testarum BC008]